MAGADQSRNLGGMLSQIGTTLGTPMDVNPLMRNIENTMRPTGIDPNSIEDMQQLQQFQQRLGRDNAARTTLGAIGDLRAKQEEAEQDQLKKTLMGFRNQYQQALASGDQALAERVKQAANQASQKTGVDMTKGISQVDQERRVEKSAEQNRERFLWAQQARAKTQQAEEAKAAYLKASPEERATIRNAMLDNEQAGVAMQMEEYDRATERWQMQKDKADNEANLPPVTPGEREVLNSTIERVRETNPKLGERWASSIESIENDGILSNQMKRQRIDKMVNSARAFNLNNESAEAAAARAAKKKASKTEDLKSAPEWMYTAVGEQINQLGLGDFIDFVKGIFGGGTESEEAVTKAIDSVENRSDLDRVTANYLSTYPGVGISDAVVAAASLINKTAEPLKEKEKEKEDEEDDPNTKNWGDLRTERQ